MPKIERPNHAILNPCYDEQQLTYKCLNDNRFDKEKCTKHVENYQLCKKFWGFVQSKRRSNGIYPYLPKIEDREEAKKKYFAEFIKNPRKI